LNKSCIAFGCLLMLVACVGVPQPSGPFITSGPLQGRIADGVFHDKRDWFSIGVPFQRGDTGYPDTQVQEAYPANISFVNFSSLNNPGVYYRVYSEDFFASNHLVPDMDHVADAVLQVYGRQLVAARLASMVFQQEKPWQAGATPGLLRLYTQKVPTELLSLDLMQNPGLAEDYTAYILMYVTSKNGKVVMLWAEWPEDCSICAPMTAGPAPATGADAIEKALSADIRTRAFLDSFSYSAGAAAYQ
jgi:hypothetical protein